MTVRPESDADAAASAFWADREQAQRPVIPPDTAAARAERITEAMRAAAEVLKKLRGRRSTAPYDRREIEAAEQRLLLELAHARN